ncbi:hypothetical protein Q5H92_22155 [Hymenobacter sp. M29]|uniref:DUF4234 domain-containing protein n=1 Tax=Hymenobacter mellowenesis TaxID=3063995 RepID=A0ABT9AGS9_9BACT|nr:hypothetical protein [Hymenobacter sp. M29]MDO7849083.1 hypothetical protein [Hymenobacter sp. M29]
MEPIATPLTGHSQAETWENYSLVSPTKFLILCLITLGLYGVWWQYKTWRFFRQWQNSDTWPVMRALFSLFTFHELLATINQFARHTGGYTPMPNTTGLVAGYVILNLLSRLPDPFWLIHLGAVGFLMPPYRAFRDAMLEAPVYGGFHQANFSTRQVVLLAAGIAFWGLVITGLNTPG